MAPIGKTFPRFHSGNEYGSYAFGDDYYDLEGLTHGLPIGQGYWEETVKTCKAGLIDAGLNGLASFAKSLIICKTSLL